MKKKTRKLRPTETNISRAKAFVLAKWKERAAELERPEPKDLTDACKFASMFAQQIFGGRLRGNHDHQWLEIDGNIVDLTDAAGVERWPEDIHEHDDDFWGNEEHQENMATCIPRVNRWVQEFLA